MPPISTARLFRLCALSALFALAACSSSNPPGSTTSATSSGSGSTTGATGGTGGVCGQPYNAGAFTIYGVDCRSGQDRQALAMAVGPGDKIGLAYFVPEGTESLGQSDLAVTYTEFQNGALSQAPAKIRTVQTNNGLTVAFDPNGVPAVGFVGGGSYFFDGGLPDGAADPMSTSWLQHSAAIATQNSDGGWTENICMVDSTENMMFLWPTTDMSASALINRGSVVGLWPALTYDGGTAVMVFRDVHDGQFPIQDWGASDAKLCEGAPPTNWSWTAPETVAANNDHKHAGFGGHNAIAFGPGGALGVASDTDTNDQETLEGGGSDIVFVQQNLGAPLGSDWGYPVAPFNPKNDPAKGIQNSQSGPSLTYDPVNGYSLVAVDVGKSTPLLQFVHSINGSTWMGTAGSAPDPIYQTGSGGFYPSLAIDVTTDYPHVAFTICSLEPAVSPGPGNCSTDAALTLAVRGANGNWTPTQVLPGSYFLPKLAFLSTHKRVLAFRSMDNSTLGAVSYPSGTLFVAVEN